MTNQIVTPGTRPANHSDDMTQRSTEIPERFQAEPMFVHCIKEGAALCNLYNTHFDCGTNHLYTPKSTKDTRGELTYVQPQRFINHI